MGIRLTTLGADSDIPGFSRIFNSTGFLRKSFWIGVVLIFITLTIRDLIDLIKDYIQYPVTVNVRVADSRVLPFPAITICNLNLVHRKRFCSAKNIQKPEIIENILCAKIGDMLNQCKISNMMEELMEKGENICGLKKSSTSTTTTTSNNETIRTNRFANRFRPGTSTTQTSTTSSSSISSASSQLTNNNNRKSSRGKRQIQFRDIMKTVREVGNAVRGDGQKGSSIIDIYNDFQDSVKSMADGSGGPLDETLTQLANFLGFNVSNSLDIIPMLFMKAFTDTTGCRLGTSDVSNILPDNIRLTLKKLTKTFMNRECLFKTPRLIRLFHDTSQKIVKSLSNCTTPWLEMLKKSVKKGETPWFFLLDLLSSWLADLAKNHPEDAKKIGHHSKDLIKQCIFAGRHCDSKNDFSHFFYNSYGNCFTYNLNIEQSDQMMDQPQQQQQQGENLTISGIGTVRVKRQKQDSLSGFTGPKFGLELVLNLETEQYMPTSRESGAKIIIHDSTSRADPDQDSVHVAPGLVTYIGVRMVNITRLSKPYPDKCSNVWQNSLLENWAKKLNYDAYSTQICLKLCLQYFTIKHCGCWSPSSPPPTFDDNHQQCNSRLFKKDEQCVDEIRKMYYNETINCDCPPRCTELSFEKFVSTGQELQQCSILTTANLANNNNNRKSNNNRKGDVEAVETTSDDIENDDEDNQPEQSNNNCNNDGQQCNNSEMKLDKDNMAKVVIYFQSLSYQEITQYPKYTLTTLLGGIGGILGVYMGFSFLALFEVFDLFGRVFCCITGNKLTSTTVTTLDNNGNNNNNNNNKKKNNNNNNNRNGTGKGRILKSISSLEPIDFDNNDDMIINQSNESLVKAVNDNHHQQRQQQDKSAPILKSRHFINK